MSSSATGDRERDFGEADRERALLAAVRVAVDTYGPRATAESVAHSTGTDADPR